MHLHQLVQEAMDAPRLAGQHSQHVIDAEEELPDLEQIPAEEAEDGAVGGGA